MPPCTIIPVLPYPDVKEAIQWLRETFGFSVRWQAGNHRAQLDFDGGCIAVTLRNRENAASDFSLMVRVENVDQHYAHCQKQGATTLSEPVDFPYGERQYSVADIGGYLWTFSASIKDLAPEDWGGVSGKKI